MKRAIRTHASWMNSYIASNASNIVLLEKPIVNNAQVVHQMFYRFQFSDSTQWINEITNVFYISWLSANIVSCIEILIFLLNVRTIFVCVYFEYENMHPFRPYSHLQWPLDQFTNCLPNFDQRLRQRFPDFTNCFLHSVCGSISRSAQISRLLFLRPKLLGPLSFRISFLIFLAKSIF